MNEIKVFVEELKDLMKKHKIARLGSASTKLSSGGSETVLTILRVDGSTPQRSHIMTGEIITPSETVNTWRKE